MLDTSEANNLDIHMQKTTEYGAMAILSVSSYGNPNKITSGETTTGNSTGVVMPLKYEWTQGGDTTWYDSRYRNYYDRDTRASRVLDRGNTPYSGYSYDDIILSNRGEAEDVISRMDELIDAYGLVRVADLYDLVGITGNYTDNKYGWTNIRNAEIIRVRDGYMIKMPRAIPID